MIGRPALQSRVTRADDARYQGGTRTSKVTACIWHATAGDTATGARGWMDRLDTVVEGGRTTFKPLPPSKRASYHYVIDKDGRIIRTVHTDIIANHAGASSYPGLRALRGSLNHCTIGVSFANDNGSDDNPDDDDLTEEQLCSGLWLGSVLMETFGYPPEMNLQHREVSPGRKPDIAPHILDADHWRTLLGSRVWPTDIVACP